MKEKEGLLDKDGKELDVIVVDGREKSPSFVSIEKPPSDRYACYIYQVKQALPKNCGICYVKLILCQSLTFYYIQVHKVIHLN